MKIKKLISILLSTVLALSGFAISITAFAADVEINSQNFPDAVWRSVVESEYVDADQNHSLSTAEINRITSLPLSFLVEMYGTGDTISDLKGIEYFTALTSLNCGDLGVEKLDVSALTRLRRLTAQGNNLTSLDVSKNTNLTDLVVKGNKELASLTLGSGIQSLQCDECNLSSLNVSMCKDLTKLICYYNQLTELDLSQNTKLAELNCSYNHLASLDLSGCTGLSEEFSSYNTQGQTITAPASLVIDLIYVSVPLPDAARVAGSNIINPFDNNYDNEAEEVEIGEYTGYNGSMGAFEISAYEQVLNGFDYTYGVGIDGMEDMQVHVSVDKSFYRVRYIDGNDVVDMQYVTEGKNAAAPSISDLSGNNDCVGWSGSGVNITEDTDIYAVRTGSHSYVVSAFNPSTGTAVLKCSVCGHSCNVLYADSANAAKADSNYVALLDANNDGVINNRDFAVLTKMFK